MIKRQFLQPTDMWRACWFSYRASATPMQWSRSKLKRSLNRNASGAEHEEKAHAADNLARFAGAEHTSRISAGKPRGQVRS